MFYKVCLISLLLNRSHSRFVLTRKSTPGKIRTWFIPSQYIKIQITWNNLVLRIFWWFLINCSKIRINSEGFWSNNRFREWQLVNMRELWLWLMCSPNLFRSEVLHLIFCFRWWYTLSKDVIELTFLWWSRGVGDRGSSSSNDVLQQI